jgi:hypothetical protein
VAVESEDNPRGWAAGAAAAEESRWEWRRGHREEERRGREGVARKGTEVRRVRGCGGGIRLGVGWWEGGFTKVYGGVFVKTTPTSNFSFFA